MTSVEVTQQLDSYKLIGFDLRTSSFVLLFSFKIRQITFHTLK
jgi:hypothetical protein